MMTQLLSPRRVVFWKSVDIKSLPALPEAPDQISVEDEADLKWRFGDPSVVNIYNGGNFGHLLEKAAAFGYGAVPCRWCGGRWGTRIDGDGNVEVVRWRDGTGRSPKQRRWGRKVSYSLAISEYRVQMKREHKIVIVSKHPDDPTVRQAVVEAFAKRGELVLTETELRDMFPTLPDDSTETCVKCNGIGVVPRASGKGATVTARPTGSSRRTGSREALSLAQLLDASHTRIHDGYVSIDLESLERLLHIDSRLRAVCFLSEIARLAL
jgi:hypothetical protein